MDYSNDIILTGDRTTGPLHLGHYAGSLCNRLKLQSQVRRQFLLLADLQALTDNAHKSDLVRRNVMEVALDYLAVGLDPARSPLVLQSDIPELAELTFHYLNIVTVARLERNPTVKAEIRQKGFRRDIPAGFLCYPVSQAADITGLKATLVPTGEDQLAMIEQTNEIVDAVNRLASGPLLPRVKPLLSATPRLIGTDGKAKASKSLGNAISLSAPPDEIRAKVRAMYTDPKHLRASDPGQVEGNVVFDYLDAFDPEPAEVEELKARCRAGGLGDALLKQRLEGVLSELLEAIRLRRAELARDPVAIAGIIEAGTREARAIAVETLAEIRGVFGLKRLAVFC